MMRSARSRRSTSQPRPMRSITPAAKFSTTTSLAAHRRLAASIASGRFKSSAMLFFPWLYWLK